MNKFIRRNNKKLMAVAGVFLMITFAANSRYGPGSGTRGSGVIGQIGNEKISESDLEDSRQQWRLLKQALAIEDPRQPGQYRSFLMAEFPATQEIDQEPKLYLLLQEEAQRLGADVTDQEVQEFLTDPRIDIQMPTGSIARFDQMQTTDPDYAIEVKAATAGFLRVAQAANRARDLCKLSRPLTNYALAQDHQNISVRVVNFDANKLNSKVPAPTTQALEKQFEQFADVEATGAASDKNPLGIGYKIPDQVRLQTISVSRRQLKDAVAKSKSDYDWEVLARSYYLKHRGDFPATQPAAPPASAMMTLPTTEPSATTKPFEQVRAEVLERVMASDVDDLSDRVQKLITGTLAQDWSSYHAAHPQTQPSTDSATEAAGGSTTLGAPYGSYDYLKTLAAKVQKDLNVLPDTAAYNQPLSSSDLSKLPGIGRAHIAAAESAGAPSTPFEESAMDSSLAVLSPSSPLQDDESTFYLFRIVERIPAHPPASMAIVADAVKSDWVKAQAYETALSQANALRDSASKLGLTAAAASAGQLVVTTPPFSAGMVKATEPVPTVPLTGEDIALFKQKCQAILESAAKQEAPVGVVEAPNESKVLVIELAEVTPDWAKGQRYVAEAEVTRELMSELARPLTMEWFTLAAVEARLGYTDAQKNKAAS